MAFVPVPNTSKVTMVYRLDGQQMVNTFHVEGAAPADNATMIQIAQAFVAAWGARLRIMQSPYCVLEKVEVRDLTTQNGLGIEYTTGLPAAGINNGTTMPNNVALAAKLGTGLTGRSFRGRTYFGGATDNWRDAPNSPNDTIRNAILGFFADLGTALANEALQMVVTSLVSGGVQRAQGVTTPITSFTVNDTFDSQRRRLPERGA